MLNEFCLKVNQQLRLQTFADIQSLLNRVAQQEEFLKKELLEAAKEVSQEMYQFLEDEGTINDLMKYGRSSRKIVHDDNPYGFKNATMTKESFSALKKAWGNSVMVMFSHETHRTEVIITVP